MEREPFVIAETERGRIAISPDAITQIVGSAAAESYGVVALAGRGRLSRVIPWGIKKGVDVDLRGEGLVVELRVVVEHGLKLAEVAETVRSRVQYELERMVDIPIASLEVHIEGTRSQLMELELVRHLARSALQNLEAHRRRIDDLNVYPVPDGDTGTNLVLTLRSIVEALEASTAADSEAVAKDVTRAALMGARGNSGVIFSQIVRGFVEVLGQHEGISSGLLGRAFRGASDTAYRAVKRPVEGTMLTVIREMAEESEKKEHRRVPPNDVLRAVLAAGEDAVARTTEMLDVLRNAGVVDAGGAGLVEIARGMVYGATGDELPDAPIETEAIGFDAIHLELSEYRYCTVFVVEGEALDAGALETELEKIGDSLLVVGDETALKVHVHTDDPGQALTLGTAVGVVEGVEIANMHHQTAQREERLLEGNVPSADRDSRDGPRRGVPGTRESQALRRPRRHAGHRRRPVHEPVREGHPRGDRGRPDGRRARPAEQLERRPHGRAGRVDERQERPRDPGEVGAGGIRGDGAVRRHRVLGGQRARDARGAGGRGDGGDHRRVT